MKVLAGILLTAGCLFGAPQAHAQTRPAEPAQGLPAKPGQGQPADFAAEFPAVPAKEFPAEFAARANAVTRALRVLSPGMVGLYWLHEEKDPLRREQLRVQTERNARARESVSVLAIPKDAARNHLQKEVGAWRLWISNTSVNNWSPFQDRALDARTIRFPVPRNARADKRTDQMKALDRMRQQRR